MLLVLDTSIVCVVCSELVFEKNMGTYLGLLMDAQVS